LEDEGNSSEDEDDEKNSKESKIEKGNNSIHVHLNTLHLRDEAHGSNNIYTFHE